MTKIQQLIEQRKIAIRNNSSKRIISDLTRKIREQALRNLDGTQLTDAEKLRIVGD